jgi:hypothetical protein
MTVGVVTVGKDTVSDPIMMPEGPRTTVSPFGSVSVVGELGKGKEDAPITIPSGTEVSEADDADTVLELAGSKVKVSPSVVIARGLVPDGKPMVSVPMTIPLGPRITDCPLGSVKVVEVKGKV